MNGDGGPPDELIDVILAERFGWTFSELDNEDMARVLPSVSAANIHDVLARVKAWMEAAGQGAKVPLPSESDLAVWGAAQNALKNDL